jgi:hypothetical protein
MQKKHGFGCSLGTVVLHLPLPAFAVTNWSLALLQAGNSLGIMRGPWFPHPSPPPPLTPSSNFCGVQYSLLGTSYYRRDTQYSRPDFYRKYIAHQPQVCLCISAADPGCLSRILIFTHPGSRIQKQQQKRGVKKLIVIPIFVATNLTKLIIFVFLNCGRKKFGPIFKFF